MDFDLMKGKGRRGKKLIILPDADISEPGSESESENNVDNADADSSLEGESIIETKEHEDEPLNDDIPLGQLAPILRPIHFT